MRTKQKNVLIAGLLAIVLVMAVGYAAFATQLQINSTANIESSWNVHFDPSKTGQTGGNIDTNVISITKGLAGATHPDATDVGTISYSNSNLTASISTKLTQPGDSVTYTLTIQNEGTLRAAPDTPTLNVAGATSGAGTLTQVKGNIQYTVTAPTKTLAIKNGSTIDSDVMTITATFLDATNPGQAGATTGNGNYTQTANATVTINYHQA